jgi:hypothetical protein
LSAEWVANELTRRRFKTADVDDALADLARIASRTGDRVSLRGALDLLADRNWPGVKSLRAEFAAQLVEPPVVTHRVAAGRPLLYRPRDLTFALVSQIVAADLSKREQTPSAQPQAPR